MTYEATVDDSLSSISYLIHLLWFKANDKHAVRETLEVLAVVNPYGEHVAKIEFK